MIAAAAGARSSVRCYPTDGSIPAPKREKPQAAVVNTLMAASVEEPPELADEPPIVCGQMCSKLCGVLTWKPLMRCRLMIINITLLLISAAVFTELERPAEIAFKERRAALMVRINASLSEADYAELLDVVGLSASKLDGEIAGAEGGYLGEMPGDWDFTSCVFFAFTLASTLGYGYAVPSTTAGRAWTMFYALISIPLCLKGFVDVSSNVLSYLALKMAGRQKDLPMKVFNMIDSDHSGTLSKQEVIDALPLLGLDIHGNVHNLEGRKRFEATFASCDRDGSGEVELHEFRLLLSRLAPDDEPTLLLVDVVARGRVALVAVGIFVVAVAICTGCMVAIKSDENWSVFEAFYFSMITFFTIGLGDYVPDPHPTYYMVIFVTLCYIGLGFTAAMVQALSDPGLNIFATLRGFNTCRKALKEADQISKNSKEAARQLTRTGETKLAALGSSGKNWGTTAGGLNRSTSKREKSKGERTTGGKGRSGKTELGAPQRPPSAVPSGVFGRESRHADEDPPSVSDGPPTAHRRSPQHKNIAEFDRASAFERTSLSA